MTNREYEIREYKTNCACACGSVVRAGRAGFGVRSVDDADVEYHRRPARDR